MEDEDHYMGDNDDWILRLAKVVAIKEYIPAPESVGLRRDGEGVTPDPKWLIVCEGGYSLDTCDRELADRVWSFLTAANQSDENYFSRAT